MEKDQSAVAIPGDPVLQPTIDGESALNIGMRAGHRG
jgi:hypothetical protein